MNRRQFLALSALATISGPGSLAGALDKRSPGLSPDDFTVVVEGIEGAEGLATAPDGTLAFSCSNAAAGLRRPDRTVTYIGEPIATGGMAFDSQCRIVAASVGALHGRDGPLRRIDPVTGEVEILVAELGGRKLVASNCPVVARDGTIYCSHSGWTVGNIGTTRAEGFIYTVSPGGEARIVATGLRGVNGLCPGVNDDELFAALTAEGRLVAWDRTPDGSLSNRRYASPPLGIVKDDQMAAEIRAMSSSERGLTGYCDGVVIDRNGCLVATLPFANRIVVVNRKGQLSTLIHDPSGKRINFPTNLAWGGPDLRDLYVVSRGNGSIVKARMEAPGIPAANWTL